MVIFTFVFNFCLDILCMKPIQDKANDRKNIRKSDLCKAFNCGQENIINEENVYSKWSSMPSIKLEKMIYSKLLTVDKKMLLMNDLLFTSGFFAFLARFLHLSYFQVSKKKKLNF